MAITPYLYYEDVWRTMKFLAKAFGLRKYGVQMRGTDGKIRHAAMKLDDALIMMGRPHPRGARRHGVRPSTLWSNGSGRP